MCSASTRCSKRTRSLACSPSLVAAVLRCSRWPSLNLRLEVFDPLELVPEASKRTPELYIEVMRSNGEAVKATMKS